MRNIQTVVRALAPACVLLLAGAIRSDAALIYAGAPLVSVDGTPTGVKADDTDSTYQSTFSSNFLVISTSQNGDLRSSGPIPLYTVPYSTIGNVDYFNFLYDSQQTQSSPAVTINNISITAGANVIWQSSEAIDLNPSGQTPTPGYLGNSADMVLLVPVSFFSGLKGSDTVVFSTTQTNGDDGPDEWALSNAGQFFRPDDPIAPVPEPSVASLLLLGAGLMIVPAKVKKYLGR